MSSALQLRLCRQKHSQRITYEVVHSLATSLLSDTVQGSDDPLDQIDHLVVLVHQDLQVVAGEVADSSLALLKASKCSQGTSQRVEKIKKASQLCGQALACPIVVDQCGQLRDLRVRLIQKVERHGCCACAFWG